MRDWLFGTPEDEVSYTVQVWQSKNYLNPQDSWDYWSHYVHLEDAEKVVKMHSEKKMRILETTIKHKTITQLCKGCSHKEHNKICQECECDNTITQGSQP